MKRILLIACIILPFLVTAQSDGISYQAVIIDNNDQEIPGINISGNYLSNGEITLRFSIINSDGNTEYQETQELTTDTYGLVNAIIGWGAPTGEGILGFQEIDWDGTPRQLHVELRYADTDFLDFGTQELVYVPYAAHRNITASGVLDVEGTTNLGDSLIVENGSSTTLTGNLDVFGDATFQGNTTFNTITVENESDLQGDLFVGGPALFENTVTIEDALTVENQAQATFTGNTLIDGNLIVENESQSTLTGNTSIGGTFTVQNESQATLTGNTAVGGTFTVSNQSQSTLTGNTSVQGALTVGSTSALNGQVTINATLTGNSTAMGAYPLRVQGSNQGVAIKVNGTRNASKNFLTFFDGTNSAHGRIEGQTLSELENSFRFIWDFTMAGLSEGFVAAEGFACSGQLDFAEAGVMAVNVIVLYAQWIELTVNATDNVGVAFLSGGADYAEWLERENPNDKIFPGEVVGLRGGKISRNTEGAQHVMAISTNPIVLGNMPEQGKESRYEKVAFMGQVPVRIAGPVQEGDYVLPSGKNDGLAIAVRPAELPSSAFREIIGVAWESNADIGMHVVNVAVGLNTNDLAGRVSDLEAEVQSLKSQMDRIEAMLAGGPVDENAPAPADLGTEAVVEKEAGNWKENLQALQPKTSQTLTDAEFENWITTTAPVFEAQMGAMRDVLNSQGVDYERYPDIAMILNDPVQALRDMRSGKYLESVWRTMEAAHSPK
jgi:hypothetical protein